MADSRRRDRAAGAALTGGGALLVVRPHLPGEAVNRAYRAHQANLMNTRTGTLGGLTAAGTPVDPLSVSGKRGQPVHNKAGERIGREPPARHQVAGRWQEARAPYHAKITRGLVHGRRAGALAVGSELAGLAGMYHGTKMLGRASDRGVREQRVIKVDAPPLFPTSQDLVGIPPWRKNPIDPLAMSAASSVMAGILTGASGRSLSRKQKRAVRRNAFAFVGQQHMVVQPTGMRGLVTP